MTVNRFACQMSFKHKLRMSVAGLVALASTIVLGLANITLKAQATTGETPSTNPQTTKAWEKAAGGKMEFEVASIHPAEPDSKIRSSFPLNIQDRSLPSNGRLSADLPLAFYIQFAYRITLTPDQIEGMTARLPKWVANDKFVIEARTEGNPTTDQMRLMMQSLLADRFKLALHFEHRSVSALVLVLARPGTTGSRLRAHSEGPACDAKLEIPPEPSSPSVPPGGFMPVCGSAQVMSGAHHTVLLGARDVTLQYIASYLSLVQNFGRPISDETGLSGTFDFSLDWTPEPSSPLSSLAGEQPDGEGTDLLEALREQLGLKLISEKVPTEVPVIDHIEQPSQN
jgi:bla regulator protein blaR1